MQIIIINRHTKEMEVSLVSIGQGDKCGLDLVHEHLI